MSHTNLCRLCINVCKDCKSLYFETGQVNEIYEIAVKYFHPMFLCVDQKNQNTVICLDCWHHISDFHSYQQSVFQAQQKLLEEEPHMEFQSAKCTSASDMDNLIKKEEDEDSMSLPDFELMEECSYGDIKRNDENDDTSNKPACSQEDSDNVGTVVEVNNPETTAELHKDQSIFEGSDENINSDGNQMINSIKRKRGNRKSQAELDSCIYQWRPHLECVICGVMHTSFALLQHHFSKQHATSQCYISCCNRKFNTRARIEEHARFHLDPNAFKCFKCGSKLSSSTSLYTHIRKCQSAVKYCEPLSKPQRIKKSYTKTPLEEIDNFIALYKPNLECELCHEICPRFTLIKTHFRQMHPAEEAYVTCCQRKFISRSALKEHVWLHMDPNAFKCNICGRHQSSYNSLQNHMERIHSTPQTNICLKDISISTEMQPSTSTSVNENINLQHLSLEGSTIKGLVSPESHSISAEIKPQRNQEIKPNGNKKYNEFDEILSAWKPILECVVCGESCRTYTKLQEHFRIKHPKSHCYFLCCNEQLNSRPTIEKHMRFHRDPNVYKCHICSDCYKSRQTLREHMLLQHPELGINN